MSFIYRLLVKNRQSLRKESSAKAPLRKGALARINKLDKMEDPLQAAVSIAYGTEQMIIKIAMKTFSKPFDLAFSYPVLHLLVLIQLHIFSLIQFNGRFLPASPLLACLI